MCQLTTCNALKSHPVILWIDCIDYSEPQVVNRNNWACEDSLLNGASQPTLPKPLQLFGAAHEISRSDGRLISLFPDFPLIPRIAGTALAFQQMRCHLAPGQDPKARDELGKCYPGIGLLTIMPDSHGPERRAGS